ncbi:unnamed protein product, partial [Ectocarpus fasciculatus]
YRGRLAPSPSGELHLGHAQTFWIAYQRSLSQGGDLVLRIEDLDRARCKDHFYTLMYQSMLWFGVRWTLGPTYDGEHWTDGAAPSSADIGPYLQSERRELYQYAWKILYDGGYLYPSNHSRKTIEKSLSAPHEGEGEVVFPTSLRCDPADVPTGLTTPDAQSWRFRVPDGEMISFTDVHMGSKSYTAGVDFGDFLVWRFDGFPSYEMAVVIDDLAMGISEIVRGEDLMLSTARQILLYRAFGILDVNMPNFFHTPLVRDPETGKRLAKRDGARSLRVLQENGWTPEKLREKLCCFDGVVL